MHLDHESPASYLRNQPWENLATLASDSELKELVLTGSAEMTELPSSPVVLVDPNSSATIDKILAFGCGIGRNFKHYKRFYKEVHGYDLPPMIDRCRSMSKENVDLLTSDWNKILLNKYDMVVAQFVFQHLLHPNNLSALLNDISGIGQYLYVSGRCYMDSPLHDKVFDTILSSNLFELIDASPGIDNIYSAAYPSEDHFAALFRSIPFKVDTTKKSNPSPRLAPISGGSHEEIKSRTRNTNNEEVDIIILAEDDYNLTEDCILSLIKNVKYPEYRITLCYTGSKPKSSKLYEGLADEISSLSYKRASKYHFSTNYNDAIAASECSYILILNNDTVALNDFLSEMMKYAMNNRIGAVGCQLFYPNNTIQHAGQRIFDRHTGKIMPDIRHHLISSPVHRIESQFIDGVTCACMLISKRVYEEVGGLGTEYMDLFQDVDLNLKLRSSGYEIYLASNASMIHYDGSTRKPALLKNSEEFQEIISSDIDKFQKKWSNTPMIKESKRGVININNKDPIFSFVTLVNDEKEYCEFLDSIDTEIEYEIIGLKNYNNFFDCPSGLNVGAELCTGHYIVFCHQDILLCPKWCELVLTHISAIEETDDNWGVLAIAGINSDNGIGLDYLLGRNPLELIHDLGKDVSFQEAETVDELLMICKNQYTTNASEKYFDPKLHGFHFYGADLCLNQRYKFGAKSYLIDCPVFHKSIHGMKNLQTNEQWRDYVKTGNLLLNKWQSNGINKITTTTCSMDMDGTSFVAKLLHGK